jgi:F-type H+-transporting ATPase subunit gamma
MANLKDIRNRIKSVKSIQQVTNAMKMVAAAKLRRSQERMEQARPYDNHLSKLVAELLADVNRNSFKLLQSRENPKRFAFIVVTSDRGLAASFNSSVIKIVENEIAQIGKENADLFCIGKKGRDHFKKRNYNLVESHVEFWNELNFNHAIEFARNIIDHFLQGKVDGVKVVYNYFKSSATQEVRNENFLPLSFDETNSKNNNLIYEPSKEIIVKSIIPRHLNDQMWKFLLESYASEQAARMIAMENATNNAGDMIKDLQLQYNKARQSVITTEMLEIISGAEALGN